MSTTKPELYSIKIKLVGASPQIWRRIHLDSTTTLGTLHTIIQEAMGWMDCHLHSFTINRKTYETRRFDPDDSFGMNNDYDDFGLNNIDGTDTPLRNLVGPGAKFMYTYDFGDSWDHEVKIERVVDRKPKIIYPTCTAGARACPPEDCGGVWGYESLLEKLAGPDTEEKAEMLEWLGGLGNDDFDPEHFDKQHINDYLSGLGDNND
ncbi:hypothetical protein BGZ76_001460 [Entomortierella beljakovae]|nr:hypothetical protein BGZ76_001460 [Entomortierella beljakovae]